MFKKTGTVAVVALALLISGCAAESSSQTNPVAVGTNESPYSFDYVELPDGRTVTCLWYNKGWRSGSMSCDWANAQ